MLAVVSLVKAKPSKEDGESILWYRDNYISTHIFPVRWCSCPWRRGHPWVKGGGSCAWALYQNAQTFRFYVSAYLNT